MVLKLKATFLYSVLIMLLSFFTSANLLSAQNPFKAAITVNNLVITHFEVIQRELYNKLVNTPGNPKEKAIEDLIEDRIKKLAMIKYNINVSDKELNDEFVGFAARLGGTKEEFIQTLNNSGIGKETVEDFLKVRVGWSKLIFKKFSKLASVSEQESEHVELYSNLKSQVFFLLSEIALPVDEGNKKAVVDFFRELKKEKRSLDQFSQLAKQYSRSESAQNGGTLDWRSLSTLPVSIHTAITRLQVGELSEPIWLNNSLIVFQMRGKRIPTKETEVSTVVSKSDYKVIQNQLVQERFNSYAEGFLLKLTLEARVTTK
jgi:peptidyl-prolyl cis-trans isomerase SurA